MKKDFPQFHHHPDLVYLDSAATTLKPYSVLEAMDAFYKKDYGTVHRAIYSLAKDATKKYNDVREKVARFLGVKESCEVIFTKGTTEAINLVAFSFSEAFIQEGDEIVISALEHHSNIVPWQMAAERKKAVLRFIPIDADGCLDMEAYRKLLNPKTKMVAIAHIANSIGTKHPIEEITKLAHEKGAKVLLDAAQSAPHIPLDVEQLGVDFLVFSGHKVYGPTGIGVLWGKEELLNQMPPYQGGGDMIEKVTLEKTTYALLPHKFEAGTPPIAEVIGLGAAIDYLNSQDRLAHYQRSEHLRKMLEEELQKRKDVLIIGKAKEKGAIVSFVVPGIHHLDIGTLIDLKGIAVRTGHTCAQPTMDHFKVAGIIRASFGIYSDEQDVEKFLKAFDSVLATLKG